MNNTFSFALYLRLIFSLEGCDRNVVLLLLLLLYFFLDCYQQNTCHFL